MAKIYLNIEADDVADLRLTLKELVGVRDLRELVEDGDVDPEPDAGARQDAEPGERQRRTRRTKAQIVADEAAKMNLGGDQSGATSLTPNGSGDADDPFAEPKTSSQPTSSDSSALTLQNVRDAMSAYLSRDNHDAADMKAILRQFKNETGEGVQRIGEIAVVDYPAAIEALSV